MATGQGAETSCPQPAPTCRPCEGAKSADDAAPADQKLLRIWARTIQLNHSPIPDLQKLCKIHAYCYIQRREEITSLGMRTSFKKYHWSEFHLNTSCTYLRKLNLVQCSLTSTSHRGTQGTYPMTILPKFHAQSNQHIVTAFILSCQKTWESHYQAKEVWRQAHKLSSLVKDVSERAALPFLWCRNGVKAVFIRWARCGHPNCSASNTWNAKGRGNPLTKQNRLSSPVHSQPTSSMLLLKTVQFCSLDAKYRKCPVS